MEVGTGGPFTPKNLISGKANSLVFTVTRRRAVSWGLRLIWRAIVGVILGRTVDVYIEWG